MEIPAVKRHESRNAYSRRAGESKAADAPTLDFSRTKVYVFLISLNQVRFLGGGWPKELWDTIALSFLRLLYFHESARP